MLFCHLLCGTIQFTWMARGAMETVYILDASEVLVPEMFPV